MPENVGDAYSREAERSLRETLARHNAMRCINEHPVEERSSLPIPIAQAVTFDYAQYLNSPEAMRVISTVARASMSHESHAHAIREAAQRRFVERQQSRIMQEVGNAPISDWADPVGDALDRLVVARVTPHARVAPHVAGAPISWGEVAPPDPPADEPQASDDWRGDACAERRPIPRERLAAHDSRDRMRERTGEERVRVYTLANRLKDGNIE